MKYFILIFIQCHVLLAFAQNKSIHFKDGVTDNEIINKLPIRIVTEFPDYIEIEYLFDDAEIKTIKQDTTLLQLINIQGMGKMNKTGEPALPCYNDIFVVPSKSGLDVKIVESSYQDFIGFYIAPAIEPKVETYANELTELKFDKDIYNQNKFYPENLAEIISIQDYREAPIAFIQIRPVQFNPKTKTIRCYSRIKYHVTFSSSLKAPVSLVTNDDSYNILKNVISNTTISTESTSNSILKSANAAMPTNRSYIIITTNAFLNAAKEFADWKTRLGFSCEIVSQPSWDSAQVKSAINQRYVNWNPKPEYFVIIGDHENVPGEVRPRANAGYYASDLYYACMGGSNDYTADMARGRISVSSLDQAFTVVRKIIDYERNPPAAISFYNNGVNCSQFEDDDTDGNEDSGFTYSSEMIRNYMILKGFAINRVYAANPLVYPRYYSASIGNGSAIPGELRKDISPFYPWTGNNSNISSEINAGRFYALYRGHGLENSWTFPVYTSTDIANLNNGNKLPVIFSITCKTGAFLQTECFAEKLLRHSNGGAVGIFAASQISYSGWNDALAVGMFDAIWSNPGLVVPFGSKIQNPIPHSDIYPMGKVLNQGLLRMAETYDISRYQNEIFHYFGAPSMEMYTALPSIFSNVSVSENGSSVTVNTGISNCKITICSLLDLGNTCYEVANNVSTRTFYNVVKPYYITVTKHNYKPYLYPQDIFLQNYAFTQYRLIDGNNINVGSNVTTTYAQGPVSIESGANITLNADQNVLIANDFEVKLGATFEAK